MKATRVLLLFLAVAAGIVIGFGYGRWYGPGAGGADGTAAQPSGYHCPMHPSYRSSEPGDCGICGMRLVPDEQPSQPAPAADSSAADASAMPMGTIHVSPARQQLIGVTYGEVETVAGEATFRTTGKVGLDETRLARVQTRIDGWIDEVFVDFTGKLVEKGQPLLTLYSPEMLASQQEFLLAMRSRDLLRNSPLESAVRQSESLLQAARRRLELWDLSQSQIDQIARTGTPITNVTLYSPISGHVILRNAFPKQRISPETELYTVADLTRVWIMADVFESEAALVREGAPVTVSLPYSAGRSLAGRVDYIQPELDGETRTLKVRIEAANPGLVLKPEMFVDVEFRLAQPARLSVPAEAVLDSGLRRTVFVDRGNGHLEPRQVQTGARFGGRIEITGGLKAGERVVTSGNFLIDSESQLKAAAAGMADHQHD